MSADRPGPPDPRPATTGPGPTVHPSRRISAAVAAAVTLTVGSVAAVALLPRLGHAAAPSAGATPGGTANGSPGADDVLPADPRGLPAPDFALARLDGTGPLRLSQLRGRVVVVNYWAAWCTTCRSEAAELATAHRTWRGRGVDFLGVDVQDEHAAARRFERDFGLAYPSVADTDGAVMRRFGVTGVPETFVLDAEGRVSAKWVGAIDAATLDRLLTAATTTASP